MNTIAAVASTGAGLPVRAYPGLLMMLALLGYGMREGFRSMRRSADAEPGVWWTGLFKIVAGGGLSVIVLIVAVRIVLGESFPAVLAWVLPLFFIAMAACWIGEALSKWVALRHADRATQELGQPLERRHWSPMKVAAVWMLPVWVLFSLSTTTLIVFMARYRDVTYGSQRPAASVVFSGVLAAFAGTFLVLALLARSQHKRQIDSKRNYLRALQANGIAAIDPESVVPVWVAARRAVASLPATVRQLGDALRGSTGDDPDESPPSVRRP